MNKVEIIMREEIFEALWTVFVQYGDDDVGTGPRGASVVPEWQVDRIISLRLISPNPHQMSKIDQTGFNEATHREDAIFGASHVQVDKGG